MQKENGNEEEILCPECNHSELHHGVSKGCNFRSESGEHCPCCLNSLSIELSIKVDAYERLFGPGTRDKLYMALKDYVDRVNFSASRGDIASRDASIELAMWAGSILPKLQIK